MIIGIGIDIIEKKRFKNILLKKKYRFEKKILNKNEIYQKNKNQKYITYIAKIFSLKEATIKALGTGFSNGLSFKKIKINNNILGKPTINNKKYKTYISISHDKNIIIAIALIQIKT